MIAMVLVCLLLVVVAALALAPPTFLSDMFDGERRQRNDWTEDDR
jgi:hypothetical protein